MRADHKLKGWQLFVHALFLGPYFLLHYFPKSRWAHPVVRYLAWAALALLAVCAYLMFTFTFSPFIVRVLYIAVFLILFGLVFACCWMQESQQKARVPAPRQQYALSRAIAWMIVMGTLFVACNTLVQAFYFWVLGEQIPVYFSAQSNIFKFWVLIGFIYGFLYGLNPANTYFNRDLRAMVKSALCTLLFIFLFSGLVLLVVVYPLQRLAPVSYRPQTADFIFYLLLLGAMVLSAHYFMHISRRPGVVCLALNFLGGTLLVAAHIIVAAAYSTTLTLTAATLLEDRQSLTAARSLYARSIPYIRHDQLLAALHHRQGVLNVINGDHAAALVNFKRVLTDYSEAFGVYRKARRYVDSYEDTAKSGDNRRRILPVQHRTFEQAASCFPNSLAVILNFYEAAPISTRQLSYSIKEAFSAGTFIWKAETFLKKNNYELITTFWKNRHLLIRLLDAGYPVLLYIPGHVYTLYGYDARMEMFFTYDTARSNRWNDKPFFNLQKDWMHKSFLMSVVVPASDKPQFTDLFPELEKTSAAFAVWQKAQISHYYRYKQNYWLDYDPYTVSADLGLDRLVISDQAFLSAAFHPFPWDPEKWRTDLQPVLAQPWAQDGRLIERCAYYLLQSAQPALALELLKDYQVRLADEQGRTAPRLLELELRALRATGDEQAALSVADKLIGISNNNRSGSFAGHLFKARNLVAAGNRRAAADLLLPVLHTLHLNRRPPSAAIVPILAILDEITAAEPALVSAEKKALIDVVRIRLRKTGWPSSSING